MSCHGGDKGKRAPWKTMTRPYDGTVQMMWSGDLSLWRRTVHRKTTETVSCRVGAAVWSVRDGVEEEDDGASESREDYTVNVQRCVPCDT